MPVEQARIFFILFSLLLAVGFLQVPGRIRFFSSG